MIIDRHTRIYGEESALPGVKRVADWVRNDIKMILGTEPFCHVWGEECKSLIIYGTVGYSHILDELDAKGKVDLDGLKGRWETYSIQVIDLFSDKIRSAIVIAGSDKRGTIYGLLKLSELMGISPLINWNHVWPQKKDRIDIPDDTHIVSKEPSVKYRGFFINDEWPAFGTWATEHFGGINAKCYERVFELLLRLKGNYLWPAMWRSNFMLDGPGLASAELADELGVVVSMSHHEPCMRSGEEYSLVRGKDSIYGDAWDFNSNEEGITEFWRDGLIRSRAFENVITMGMRGECDTAIMANATLADNIDLIRRVLRTQNSLIRETVNERLDEVPRQIVLFTEVEEFFYGDEETPGLIGDEELEGVTLMLSDNNAGYLRTLPSEKIRDHKGGFGMYYHMDMHGGPHSFQWIGSTYLPRVADQMTTAYEYGVRQIWVTNIGDIGTQELGLSFFLDLAYDIDTYGSRAVNSNEYVTGNKDTVFVTPDEYIDIWVRSQFGHVFEKSDLERISDVIGSFLKLLAVRKHEALNDKVYHPVNFGEAKAVLHTADHILAECERLKGMCPDRMMSAFISLVYYPACGTANLFKMWILSGRNKLYAKQNRLEANDLADVLNGFLERDRELIDEYMKTDDGYYYGFGISEHIGFTFWNDEDCKLPVRSYITPAVTPRMIVVREDRTDYLTGDYWRDMKPRVWKDALRPDVDSIRFEIANAGTGDVDYEIRSESEWLSFSEREGVVSDKTVITVTIDRSGFEGKKEGSFSVVYKSAGTEARIIIEAYNPTDEDIRNAFWENEGYIAIDAIHYDRAKSVSYKEETAYIGKLMPYGRTNGAIRVFPVTANFEDGKECPYTEYRMVSGEGGMYDIEFFLSPSTPVVFERRQIMGYSINDGEIVTLNTVHDESVPFFLSPQWEEEAITNIKKVKGKVFLKKGLNILRFYPISPQIILEKIVLNREDVKLPCSYLGPNESYHHV